jgi:hypothetical protein
VPYLPPPLREDGLQGAAEDLGAVGGGVERQGQDGAEPWLAENLPQAYGLEGMPELAAAVIDQEDLGEQRRSAKEENIGCSRPVEPGPWRKTHERDRHGEDRTNDAACCRIFQRDDSTVREGAQML